MSFCFRGFVYLCTSYVCMDICLHGCVYGFFMYLCVDINLCEHVCSLVFHRFLWVCEFICVHHSVFWYVYMWMNMFICINFVFMVFMRVCMCSYKVYYVCFCLYAHLCSWVIEYVCGYVWRIYIFYGKFFSATAHIKRHATIIYPLAFAYFSPRIRHQSRIGMLDIKNLSQKKSSNSSRRRSKKKEGVAAKKLLLFMYTPDCHGVCKGYNNSI